MLRQFIIFLVLTPTSLITTKANEVQYLYPKPGTDHHPKQTVLIFRFNTAPELIQNRSTFFTIVGESSGRTSGELVDGTDGKTLIFKPAADFVPGEEVWVHLRPTGADGTVLADTAYTFNISRDERSESVRDSDAVGKLLHPHGQLQYTPFTGDPLILNGVAVPANFPRIDIAVNDNPSEDYLFVNARSGGSWSLILDSQGNPIWYWPEIGEQMNFQVQPDGRLTANVGGMVIAWDSTYTMDKIYQPPPGYDAIDPHEFISLPNGHYWLIVNEHLVVDLSARIQGGHPNATVIFPVIMEIDANDNPMFIWRSSDHFDVLDTVLDPRSPFVDPFHTNSIAFDNDGHILITSRHTDEVTKINRNTGDIVWRLGGKNDYFTWVNDTDRIAHQHAMLALPNGNYMVFDNGNLRFPEYSRALELSLDTVAWTATKIWEYREADRFCWSESNTQRLPNGNTLINWKEDEDPAVVEVRPDGTKTFEVRLGKGSWSYRAFRLPWKGKAKAPYLVVEPHYDRMTLIFNKFGDSEVAYYNVYGEPGPEPTTLLATSTEPFIHLSNLVNNTQYAFRVTAVSTSGLESDYSNEVDVNVQFLPPGDNVVSNGAFDQGLEHWAFETHGAMASPEVVEGEFRFNISWGGDAPEQLFLMNGNIILNEGSTYLFEFDAYAASSRSFRAEVFPAGRPHESYSRIGHTWLTTSKQQFAYSFEMTDPYDPNAAIMFGAGGSDHDVFVDNVSLKEVSTTSDVKDEVIPQSLELQQNYPNPFSLKTIIAYELPEPGRVVVRIYGLRGKLIETLVDSPQQGGRHTVEVDGSFLAPGVYFYELHATSVAGMEPSSTVRKMLIVK